MIQTGTFLMNERAEQKFETRRVTDTKKA